MSSQETASLGAEAWASRHVSGAPHLQWPWNCDRIWNLHRREVQSYVYEHRALLEGNGNVLRFLSRDLQHPEISA